jgi:LysM repeat protein
MPARKPGRFLAPLALVAVIVATVLVVRAGLGTTHHSTTQTTSAARVRSAGRVRRAKHFYVVRPGDSLSTISVKTGVPVARLEALNPAIDPQALQTGQRLRLRP